MRKKRILIFIDWFIPAYKAGGPIQSVNNLVQQFAQEFDFLIVTSDRDLGDSQAFTNVSLNTWIKKDKYEVIYLSPENQNKKYYQTLIQEKKVEQVYLNSLFSIPFAFKPLLSARSLRVKVLLAPRGMLGAGALQLKSKKKKAFLLVFKLLSFHKKIAFHATSNEEVEEIKLNFGQNTKILLASNLPAKLPVFQVKDKVDGELNVFFLSRINEKKNLLGAIAFLGQVSTKIILNFTIFGPIDGDEYWNKCQEAISKLPSNILVKYEGSVPHYNLPQKLSNQHLLLLPTQNENYGHVIMEAWQNGCPVLISDQTPWKNLEEKFIGWEFPISETGSFTSVLEQISSYSQEQFDHLSKSSYDFALKFLENPELVSSNKKIFE